MGSLAGKSCLRVSHKKLVTWSCPTLCDPIDFSPPGSSFHGILQARILEWVAISFSRGSFQPRDRAQVSHVPGRLYRLSHQGSLRLSLNCQQGNKQNGGWRICLQDDSPTWLASPCPFQLCFI